MKNLKPVLHLALALGASLTLTATAHSGEKAGNGGGAWTCRDSAGAITRIELADLWESENDPAVAVKIVRSSTPADIQIEDAIRSLHKDVKAPFSRAIERTKALILVGKIPAGTKVAPVSDELFSIVPAEAQYCRPGHKLAYEQIVNYRDDGTVLFDEKLFNHPLFSKTDQAALYIHETVYAQDRRPPSAATDSRRTRKVTARLFSSEGPSEKTAQTLKYLYVGGNFFRHLSEATLKGVTHVDLIVDSFYDGSGLDVADGSGMIEPRPTIRSLMSATYQTWATDRSPAPMTQLGGSTSNGPGAFAQVKFERVPMVDLEYRTLELDLWDAGPANGSVRSVLTVVDSDTGRILGRNYDQKAASDPSSSSTKIRQLHFYMHFNRVAFTEE